MNASDVFAVTVIGLIVVTVAVSTFGNNDIESQLESIQESGDAERAIERFLHNPRSARFRHMGNGCGAVSARDESGGYTGFRRFVANADATAIDDGRADFDLLWQRHCATER